MTTKISSTVLLLSSLLTLSATAGCVSENEYGDTCGFPFIPCGVGDGGPVGPSVRFDATQASDLEPISLAARGGTIGLVAERHLVEGGLTVTTPSPDARVIPQGGDDFVLATGSAEVVELDVTGTDVYGESFASVDEVRTSPVANVVAAPFAYQSDDGCAYGDCYELAGTTAAYYAYAALAYVQLFDDRELRLADLSISLGPDTSDGVTQPAWNEVALPTAAGDYHVTLVADSFGERSFDATVVDHVDRVTAAWSPLVHGRLCFHAFLGDLEVYAPAWTASSVDADLTQVSPNCVRVHQPGTVTFFGLGLRQDFVVEPDALD